MSFSFTSNSKLVLGMVLKSLQINLSMGKTFTLLSICLLSLSEVLILNVFLSAGCKVVSITSNDLPYSAWHKNKVLFFWPDL